MANTKNDEPISKVAVDPDGDLILVLPRAELQVSSKILCLTSTVFKVMLGTNFAEGNTSLFKGTRRVDLPGKQLLFATLSFYIKLE